MMAAMLPAILLANITRAKGIDVVSIYAGTWTAEITYLETPFRKAGKEATTIKNECWESAEFYVCHQSVDGSSAAILVFAYSSKEDSYVTYPIVPGADIVHRGKLVIQDNVWIYPWQEIKKGKTTYFRVVNIFTSADTIEFRQEFSQDQVHWMLTATGNERRMR